jgi:hypothetical protein
MKIKVQTLLYKTIFLEVESSTTILMVKNLLLKQMPRDQQRIVFDGKPLEDDRTLLSYNIQEGATLHLVVRLKSNTQGLKDLTRAIWS